MTNKNEPVGGSTLTKNAPILAKWLTIAFWISVASLLAGPIGAANETMQIVAGVWSMVATVVSLICYYKLSKVSNQFRKLWICNLLGLVFGVIAAIIAISSGVALMMAYSGGVEGIGGLGAMVWVLVGLGLAVMAVIVAVTWFFAGALAEQLDGTDDKLARNWRKLRAWQVGIIAIMIVCFIVGIFVPQVLAVTLIAAFLIALVFAGFHLAYYWKSVCVFQRVARETAAL